MSLKNHTGVLNCSLIVYSAIPMVVGCLLLGSNDTLRRINNNKLYIIPSAHLYTPTVTTMTLLYS